MIKHTDLVFGIPTQRSKNEEKHPNQAVLTVQALGEKGTARKIDINTRAAELLGLKLDGSDKVNFAFNMEDDKKVVYFANTTLVENPTNIKVTKQATFADKKMHSYLSKVFELDNTKDSELLISDISDSIGTVTVLETVVEEPAEEAVVAVEVPVELLEEVLENDSNSEETQGIGNSLDY